MPATLAPQRNRSLGPSRGDFDTLPTPDAPIVVSDFPPRAMPDFPLERSDADIREHAAQLLEQRGWIKGRSRSKDGFCMTGAVLEATGDHRRANQVSITISDELGQAATQWNDRRWRRKQQVLDALRRPPTAAC